MEYVSTFSPVSTLSIFSFFSFFFFHYISQLFFLCFICFNDISSASEKNIPFQRRSRDASWYHFHRPLMGACQRIFKYWTFFSSHHRVHSTSFLLFFSPWYTNRIRGFIVNILSLSASPIPLILPSSASAADRRKIIRLSSHVSSLSSAEKEWRWKNSRMRERRKKIESFPPRRFSSSSLSSLRVLLHHPIILRLSPIDYKNNFSTTFNFSLLSFFLPLWFAYFCAPARSSISAWFELSIRVSFFFFAMFMLSPHLRCEKFPPQVSFFPFSLWYHSSPSSSAPSHVIIQPALCP